MKSNQLNLPFGQGVKPTKRTMIETASTSPTDVYNTFRDEMKDLPVTTYKVIAVNMKHLVTVAKNFDSLPTIKQIMRWVVSNSAAALFVCRNTSSTPTIPYEEERFMVDLADAGDVVGIDLLDYLVMNATGYMSGRVEGLL